MSGALAGTAWGALAVSLGAALGALLRWQLGNRMNGWHPTVPLGTLTANVLGGYLVGLAVAWLSQHPELSPQWRLLIVTGFLGGLTTFSTFSAEVMALLMGGRLGSAVGLAILHLGGSLLATWAGITSFQKLNG
jgi:fluoride exporter